MDYDYSRTADLEPSTEHAEERIIKMMNSIVRGAGKCVGAKWYGLKEWSAIFDTEYAALKAFYQYRNSKPRLAKSPVGWVLSFG